MFDIVTLEPNNAIVMIAVNAIVHGEEGLLPKPNGNYRFFAGSTAEHTEGDGGSQQHVVAFVGHGDVNSISGHKKFIEYLGDCNPKVEWKQAKSVYLVACSTSADDGAAFLHGSIAKDAATRLSPATVWASPKAVTAKTLSGDWEKVGPSSMEGRGHYQRG
ncbi:MAG: hypothetical protein ACRYGP_07685 [Janthinobacterium lividum]